MRRAGVALLTFVVALAGVIGLLLFFQSRDEGSLDSSGSAGQRGPGVEAPEEDDPRLAAGNVILTYRREEDGERLRVLARDVSGPPDPALEEVGQAVIVLRRPNQTAGEIVAHALGRRLVAGAPDDPEVRRFAEYWLGRAAAE